MTSSFLPYVAFQSSPYLFSNPSIVDKNHRSEIIDPKIVDLKIIDLKFVDLKIINMKIIDLESYSIYI